MSEYGLGIFAQHQKLLWDSQISVQVARSRGYVSVDTKKRLEDLGFSSSQQRVPGLLIPLFGTNGEVVTYQYRPDDPREMDGRIVKYETPSGSAVALDVPRRLANELRNPRTDLWITEGARKVDALLSAGVSAIGLMGVSAWRSGGMALGDWLDITLRSRRVIIAFDSDVMTKPEVQRELIALSRYLSSKGARVDWAHLPQNPQNRQKVGIDDWLAQGHTIGDLEALATPAALDPQPVPLTQKAALPEFPTHVLPQWLADEVLALAQFTQTDPGMAGTAALGVLAAAVAGGAQIEVRPGWREPLCLFTATVAAPGERKSSVQAHLRAPLDEVETELAHACTGARLEAETTKQVATKIAERAKAAASAADPQARATALAEAIAATEHAEAILIPTEPRLIADDATPEAVATLLYEQQGSIAVISAEGGIFDIIAGRYSNNVPQLEVFLKGHAGDHLRVDRKGRAAESIPHPSLTMALMIQPRVLETIAANSEFRGRGLLARFLFCLPVSKVGRREIGPPPIPTLVADAYTERMISLARTATTRRDNRAVLRLTPQAQRAVMDFEQEVEPWLDPAGQLAHIADWGNKLVGATLRLAGLLHLAADDANQPVSASTVNSAIHLARYYQAHALAAFEVMQSDPAKTDAQTLLGVIKRIGQPQVSTRDLYAKLSRSRFPKAATMNAALSLLEDHGWISVLPDAPRQPGKAGRPSSSIYSVHPQAIQSSPTNDGRGFVDSADIAATSKENAA